ncbi:hypothetical protein [Micromonospora parva]|uniref:DUF4253 domain-containing protein n=1 Tax=Micromonospora parva TaxID=1464048 RepID=A0ABW6VP69_9ACTN|nr:hypothetical protein [Micromonospora parva]
MTQPTPARGRLDASLARLACAFRGMVAHPDDSNCECHWGSAEELALLKTPDVEVDPDLLRRTYWTGDWDFPAEMLRRILPQLATALTSGEVERLGGMDHAGRTFALGGWQRWPAEQSTAISEFLDAWWAVTLTDPDAEVPAHVVLAMLVEASGALGRWLDAWTTATTALAHQRLAEAFGEWEYDLLRDDLPWHTWTLTDDEEEVLRTELTAWLLQHAPTRLRMADTDPELPHRLRLLGLTGPARWDDPHWPDLA